MKNYYRYQKTLK